MVPERLDIGHDEAVPFGARYQLGQRRDIPSGEDVFTRPSVGCPRRSHAPAAMRNHDAVRRQQRPHLCEEAGIMWRAQMFDQPDRDDPIELTLDIAIVHQLEADAVGNPCGLRSFATEGNLVGRESDAEDVYVIVAMQVEREPTPAAPDVQHSLPWLQMQLGGEMRLLVDLRLLERHVRISVVGAGILPILVEEELVQLSRKIIGVLGVAARAGPPVNLVQPRDDAVGCLSCKATSGERTAVFVRSVLRD